VTLENYPALTAAETVPVTGTLHTTSAAGYERVVDVFPAQEKSMVRSMLSGVPAVGYFADPAEESWRRSRRGHDVIGTPSVTSSVARTGGTDVFVYPDWWLAGYADLNSCLKTLVET
jgi:twitching motility protein PilT